MNAIKNNNNTIGLCEMEEIDKRVLCFKCEEDCPLPHTAEFQFTINDEIRTDFQSVCKECYDDWEDICEKCDSRVCSVEMWIDYKGEWIYYCDECYAEDEDRITEQCSDPCCERQCIEDEDFCLPCKECREGVSDDEEEEEVKVEEPVLTEKQKERITRIRLQRQENEAMGAEDFDAPAPVPDIKWENGNGGFINIFFPEYDVPYPDFALYELIIDGKVIETEKYPRVISEGGDMEYTGLKDLCRQTIDKWNWETNAPMWKNTKGDAPLYDFILYESDDEESKPTPTPAPVRSTWDDRVSGDLQNKTICEIFGDECTWRTLANIGADPDAESELSVHIHYYQEGKWFQVRAYVNDYTILNRHYAKLETPGEIYPHTLMEGLDDYFPGYFEEEEEREVYGTCYECGVEGKFIGKEGDDWSCPDCSSIS
jgi:hypothetical protein